MFFTPEPITLPKESDMYRTELNIPMPSIPYMIVEPKDPNIAKKLLVISRIVAVDISEEGNVTIQYNTVGDRIDSISVDDDIEEVINGLGLSFTGSDDANDDEDDASDPNYCSEDIPCEECSQRNTCDAFDDTEVNIKN
jgi:hypothetical protein